LETYPEISNDIEEHKRNPYQSALDLDHELPGAAIQLRITWIRNDQVKDKEGTVKSTEGNSHLQRNLWSGRRNKKGKTAGEWV